MKNPRTCPLVLLAVTVAGLVAVPAAGQDVLSFWFDSAATVDRVVTTTPFQAVTGYLIISDPSDPSGVIGWECMLEFVTSGPAPFMNWALSGSAINLETPPQFQVGLGLPLPWAQQLLLAQTTMFVPEAGQEIEIYLHPNDPPSLLDPPGTGYPVYQPLYVPGADPTQFISLDWPAGCEGDPVAVINDDGMNPPTTMSVDVSLLDFGQVVVGNAVDLEFQVHNESDRLLSGHAWVEGAAGFIMRIGSGPFLEHIRYQIPPGQVRVIIARLIAPAPGNFEADLVLAQCDTEFARILCTGYTEVPVCQVDPVTLDFGSVLPPSTVDRIFTVSNVGAGLLAGSVGPGCAEFPIISGGGVFSLAGGESRTVTVRFQPPLGGNYACDIPVSGLGCPAVHCSGFAETAPAVCTIDPAALDFGAVQVGTADSLSLVVTNDGGDLLPIDVPASCGDFAIIEGSGTGDLLPGASRQVVIQYSPPDEGSFHCDLDLGSGLCTTVPLDGSGWLAPPVCQVEPPVLDFGEIPVGYDDVDTFTVQNTGQDTLYVDVPSSCGVFAVIGGEGMHVVTGGASHQIVVQFAPPDTGTFTCSFPIDPLCSELACQGRGVELVPGCQVSTDSLLFVNTLPGHTSSQSFIVTNTGAGDLDGDVAIDGAGFALTAGGGPFALPAGENMEVTVAFTPPDTGTWTGQVTLGAVACEAVALLGASAYTPGVGDIVGIYFDETGTTNVVEPQLDVPFQAYLCLLDGTMASGVAGWECAVAHTADPTFSVLAWNLRGNGVNASVAPDFAVDLSVPLPWAASIVLMEMTCLATGNDNDVEFFILPGAVPKLPGHPSYAPGHDPLLLVPLWQSSGDQDLPVARVDLDTGTGVQAAPPRVMAVAGVGVTLSWAYDGGVFDAFHVWRRLEPGAPERLTHTPLTGQHGRVEFTDPAAGLPAGSRLHYSYAGLWQGQEIARSQEVTVTLPRNAPAAFVLHPCYPNPFNPFTHLRFETARPGRVRLEIYDLVGRRVRSLVDEDLPAAAFERIWDGRDDAGREVPSGIYYGRLAAEGILAMQKMTLLK